MFADEAGRTLQPRTVSRWFAKHVRAAQLTPIPLKNLRHSHATIMLSQGVPAKVIQERLGHSHISITLTVYAHATPAMHADAAALVAAAVDADHAGSVEHR